MACKKTPTYFSQSPTVHTCQEEGGGVFVECPRMTELVTVSVTDAAFCPAGQRNRERERAAGNRSDSSSSRMRASKKTISHCMCV